MINEFEFYHGVVFSKLLHDSQKQYCIKPYPSPDNASYILDERIGIYIKYSTKRLSPWRFTFRIRHQEEIIKLKQEVGSVYLLLVCDDDGIVVLNYNEICQILDEHREPVEWISVARIKRKMYTVKGSDGELSLKVGKYDFPRKII